MEEMKQYRWDNKKEILAHEVLFTYTTYLEYDMNRLIVLEKEDKIIFLEGYHCSCYDFDECKWEATEFNRRNYELIVKFLKDYDPTHLREKALEFFKYYSNDEDIMKEKYL